VLTVGAAFIVGQAIEMEFRLLVNVDDVAMSLRDHPSGTLSLRWPLAEAKGTYTVVSGMSPGGLLSAGTGACEAAAGLEDLAAAGCVLGTGCGLLTFEPLEPHPARIAGITAAVMAVSHQRGQRLADVLVLVPIRTV